MESKEWENNEKVIEIIEEIEEILGDKGRVFVRASGTEPLMRVMLEGNDEEHLLQLEEKLIEVIRKERIVVRKLWFSYIFLKI
ncbi:MAG: hypothetical protein ACLFMO_05420 [Eubacteriales bacterium]